MAVVATMVVCVVVCALFPVSASDHSDAPQANGLLRQDANLTDLYAFVVGDKLDKLVIAFCSNPAIPRSAAGYLFPADVTFDVNIDNHCLVASADPDGMGGTILDPDKIRPDFKIRIRFDQEGAPQVHMFGRPDRGEPLPILNFFAGLRDDPFIRGPRQGRNVAAIVLEVPLAAVTSRQSRILLWVTSKVEDFDGPFQDLVGRALRSMMPENQAMNEMPVNHQSRALDVAPDVMIFNTALPAAFPNGRALEDDIVDLIGDPRVLANDEPFPSENDLPFLSTFPYLAPPHPPQ